MSVLELKYALRDVSGIDSLTISYAVNGNQILNLGDLAVEVSPMASNEEIRAALGKPTIPTRNTKVTVTTPLDRLKGKFLQARGVAQRVATNMEAEADSLIAQEDAMKAKTTNAFAPHKAVLAEAGTELQAIEDALNLMSNGGPPLEGAVSTDAGSKAG